MQNMALLCCVWVVEQHKEGMYDKPCVIKKLLVSLCCRSFVALKHLHKKIVLFHTHARSLSSQTTWQVVPMMRKIVPKKSRFVAIMNRFRHFQYKWPSLRRDLAGLRGLMKV